MIRERTDGNLIIIPQAIFLDPKDLDDYEAPTEPKLIHRGGRDEPDEYDDGTEGYNPLDEHVDESFNHPVDIQFNFLDPKQGLTNNTDGTLQYKRKPQDILFSLDNMEDYPEKGHNIGMGYGLPTTPGGSSLEVAAEDKLNEEESGKFLTNLARKAADRIASGKANIEDLSKLANRDNGAYEGTEITAFKPLLYTANVKKIHEHLTRTGFQNKVFDQFKKMSENTDMPFSDLVNNLISKGENEAVKQAKATTILSNVIHGIGARQFLPTLLDTMRPFRSEVVDNFLGGSKSLGDDVHSKIIRALPTSSAYHQKAVQNFYRHNC